MEIYNLSDYKAAKVMLPQINIILNIVNLSIKGLSFYKAYIPVCAILTTLQEQKVILEIYQGRYKRVLDKKGKKQ